MKSPPSSAPGFAVERPPYVSSSYLCHICPVAFNFFVGWPSLSALNPVRLMWLVLPVFISEVVIVVVIMER